MNRLARFTHFFDKSAAASDAVAHLAQDDAVDQDVAVEQMTAEELREPIIAALREVYDPEIPVNIYDLGLIYTIDIAPTGSVAVQMTLTAPGCPVAGMMPVMVRDAVARVDGVGEVQVELVWSPPWNQDNMSDEARLQLGLL
jgi:FeS assembly SUF system protein